MVPIMSLWLPIVLSAVIVFVVSSIVHMVLPFHKGDWKRLPNEDAVQEALRRLTIPPGDYLAPRPTSRQGMKDPEFIEKMNAGPVLIMTVRPGGPPSMGRSLALWFGYSLALLQNSIWYWRNWGATLRSVADGLLYGLLTAGTFGWLWPR